jgi:hypothetical protein
MLKKRKSAKYTKLLTLLGFQKIFSLKIEVFFFIFKVSTSLLGEKDRILPLGLPFFGHKFK